MSDLWNDTESIDRFTENERNMLIMKARQRGFSNTLDVMLGAGIREQIEDCDTYGEVNEFSTERLLGYLNELNNRPIKRQPMIMYWGTEGEEAFKKAFMEYTESSSLGIVIENCPKKVNDTPLSHMDPKDVTEEMVMEFKKKRWK
jgi:hypothetical protein